MDYLSVKQVAELKGCSERYIRLQISKGKLIAQEHSIPANNVKQYIIPVDGLPPDLKKKYIAKYVAKAPNLKEIKPQKNVQRNFDQLSNDERKEVNLWVQLINDWLMYREEFRRDGKNKTEADPLFVAKVKLEHKKLNISTDILYKKYKAFKDNNIEGYLDKRGGWNKGRSSIPKPVWDWFLTAFLDQRRLPITQCYDLCREWTKEFYPEFIANFPASITFRRKTEKIERAVLALAREGDKSYSDRFAPFIVRLYDEMYPNSYWVADNHTLDIISKYDGKESTHRLSITAFIDAYSGVMVGWNITDNPCSNSTVLALRHAIKRFGIPDVVYFDNGSEFLTHDIAGRGHRKRKSQNLVTDPPPIFKRLGVELRNALVRNAKAKPIERTFGTFKNLVSRTFETFCGGNITERPESLKYKLKKGQVPLDSRLNELVADMVDGIYNVGAYGGTLSQHKGKTRIQVFNEGIQSVIQKIAPEDELNLMLMRTSKPQKVQRNGVYITICGERLWYWDSDIWKLIGEEVYVRYDPLDLSQVLIYESGTDKRICQLPIAKETMLLFNDEPEKIKLAMSQIRSVKKQVKGKLDEYVSSLPAHQRISILDMRIRQAHSGKEGFVIEQSKIIQPIMSSEKPLKAAVGAETQNVIIDMNKMTSNALERKKDK